MIPRKPPAGLFARLLDGLRDTYTLVLDQGGTITYANLAFLDHFNLEWKDVSGKPCFWLGKPFTDTQKEAVGFCPSEQAPFYPGRTILTRQQDGKELYYEVTYHRPPDHDPDSWTVCTLRNVTHRFNLESQVRRLDELERNLILASMDGIVVNDMLGNIVIFNQGAARILGYAPEEVIARMNVSQLYPPGEAHDIKQKLYAPEFTGPGMLENYETRLRRKDGTLVPIWLSARILHEGDREIGIVGFFRDLSERKRLEEDLLRSERLASLGRMVAHISHEIKNPLTLIGGFARQLERLDGLPGEARRKLHLVHQEVQRLEKFLGDLSTFTRIAPTRKILGDLPALIREVAELLEPGFKEQGIEFRLRIPRPMPRFFFDPGQIRQVLLNLCKNSVEAMSRGGQLRVEVEIEHDQVRLIISDTGYGIAPEQMKMLFSPFTSTKEGGTGLGLAISRGLIEQHQGTIEIRSEEGRGTTCIINLPLAPAVQ
jgi:PAS domain S-box-containing protein